MVDRQCQERVSCSHNQIDCTVTMSCVFRAADAKKQNDHIYHEKLPPMEHLEAVQG